MFKTDKTLKIISPAKVNLFLAVGKKDGDYHPVLNVLHTILLHDVIYMNYEKSDALELNIEFLENEDSNGQRPDIKLEDNLIYKAIKALSESSSKKNFKIDVYVEKNMTISRGLGPRTDVFSNRMFFGNVNGTWYLLDMVTLDK